MRLRLVILLASVTTLVACTQATQPAPRTDEEKALYALGALVSQNIKSFDLTDQEMAMVNAGLADGARGKEILKPKEIEDFIPKLQELNSKRIADALTREKEAGTAYLAKAAAEDGARKTDSGMIFKNVEEGTGASPKSTDMVKVQYEGRFVDGKVFDSSKEGNDGKPVEFTLDGVIPCWTEGVQLMKVGGKAQLVCPPELAYGDQSSPRMRGGATLVFDVELLDIVNPAVAAAEEAAKK
jgi:FKBP-type peptidyl-prolyl cis-trans isomerase